MIELALFCRNEAGRVRSALAAIRRQAEALPDHHRPLRAVVLENGSTDTTAEAAAEAARELSDAARLEASVRADLPAGKTRSWNTFLESATSELLVFMDADVEPAPGAIAALVRELEDDASLDLISAVPTVPADFQPHGFWHSVFAVPYHGLRPAESVTGNLYAGRRSRLRPLDPDILHEDLALSLRHEASFAVSGHARVHVDPPHRFRSFVRQRVRCLRADRTEAERFGKPVARHRRRSTRDVTDFLRAGGPVRLAAFLFARLVAATLARWKGPQHGGAWVPDRRL